MQRHSAAVHAHRNNSSVSHTTAGMNARSLATELAPVMLWHEGTAASAVSKAVSSTGASSAINAGIQVRVAAALGPRCHGS